MTEIELTAEQQAMLADGAGCLPVELRDAYLACAMSILRPIREINDFDVRRAIANSLAKYQQRASA